jgi:histidinol-phosphate aminotransferase
MTSKSDSDRLVPPNIERLVPYVPGKPIEEVARDLGVTDAVKLASNENPLGPSPKGLEAVRRALGEVHRYPDGQATALTRALAKKHQVGEDEIVVGNGSAELIEFLVRTFCAPGSDDEVLAGDPSFAVYPLAAQAHGVRYVGVPLAAGFQYDVPAMLAAVTPRTRICFIANPNNPTGTYLPRPGLERLVRELAPHVVLAVDEAYFEYATAADYPDAQTLRGARERLLLLRTFSKAYGLAGLRVGYLIAPPTLTHYVHRVRPIFNVNNLAQAAALAALEDTVHVERTRKVTAEGMAMLERELPKLGLSCAPSQTNFLYVDFGRESRPVYDALLRQGVIIRPIGSPRHARITVGTEAENAKLIRALAKVLARGIE